MTKCEICNDINPTMWVLLFLCIGIFLGGVLFHLNFDKTETIGNMICSAEDKGKFSEIIFVNNQPIVKCYSKVNQTKYDGGYIEEVSK